MSELMLLRSAAYYLQAKMYDRSNSVYKNFIRRFSNSPKTVEAYFMIAKGYLEQKDISNALLSFSQAEQQNVRLVQANLPSNSFYAAEAAYNIGEIQRQKFMEIRLNLPEAQLKKSLKEKTDLMTEASKSYERVIQYQSERMFEAAYWIGQMYEEIADAWRNQERPLLDPIKSAVLENEILTLSSALLQKSFIPYKKAIQISEKFDSLGVEQKKWVQKSRTSLTADFLHSGHDLFNAIGAMSNAPIPKQIADKPLDYFQYLKLLIVKLEPMKMQLRDYYLYSYWGNRFHGTYR